MKVCTYVNRQDTYRQIWGVGWGQSTISSMFLNRDPEFTGGGSTGIERAHWRILLRQWAMI